MLSGDGVAGESDSALADSVLSGVVPDSSVSAGSSVPADASAASGGGSLLDGVVLPIVDPELRGVVEDIEGGVGRLRGRDTVAISNADRRALLTRMEAVSRSVFGLSHTWIADLLVQHGLDGIDGSVPDALAVLMRISRTRASQRIRYSQEFGKRTAVTGERLEPVRPGTAAAAEDGVLDEEHQNQIRLFFWRLREKVDAETREHAERQLAQGARDLPPDQFKKLADRLYAHLDPDGDVPPEQVADRTYVRFGHQDECGLSTMSGVVDAELRAYMEAVFSKFAKPGKCNPADDKPDVDGPDDDSDADDNPGDDADSTGGGQEGPTLFDDPDDNPDDPDDDPDDDTAAIATGTAGPGAADADSAGGSETSTSEKARAEVDAELRAVRDLRGQGRRQHDALKVVLRQMLASGKLGQHRGLPVTAVVTMTLKDLEAGTGHAFTATGSMVKMRDAIRMASHAHHYLVIFDNDGRPLHLGRSKRLASKDQRIVLMAADRGCSHPGCSRPATWSQVHHVNEWAKGGCTDIEDLTFGCDQHHRLVGPDDTDWATTKAGPEHQYPGRTLWHAPATVDPSRRGRVNHYHHPGEYLDPERSGAPPT